MLRTVKLAHRVVRIFGRQDFARSLKRAFLVTAALRLTPQMLLVGKRRHWYAVHIHG